MRRRRPLPALARLQIGELILELRPAGKTVFTRQRVLDVAKPGLGWCVGHDALEAGTSFSVVRAQRLEPPLRFPLEVLEGALGVSFLVMDAFLQ